LNEVYDVNESTPESAVSEIVVVDDDREILKLIAMLLRRIGAEVWTFEDGDSALAHLNAQAADLVVLDLNLPGLNGLEILRQLRSRPEFDRTPVLILSARADSDSIRQSLDLGADGYVTKPYIANTLIDKVRVMLQSERAARP